MLGCAVHGLNSLVLVHVCWLWCFIACTVSLTEKEILLQFKSGITGDPFDSLSSWNSGNDPCHDYHGVSCNSDGNVANIVLWNTALHGVLSPALSGLRSLRIINLYGNNFSGNIPEEYAEIVSLWKVNVSSNSLSGKIPAFLGDLPNIRFLDLSGNAFDGEIPPALFRNCDRTRFVSLAHNNLSGSIPVSVGNCVNLEGIDFSFNSLSGVLPSEICGSKLKYISVRSNHLSGNVEDQLSKCENLNSLDLGSNFFTGIPPFDVLGAAGFSYFNVSWNSFDGEIWKFESCPQELEVFDVAGNHLYGEMPSGIVQCNGLKYLDLGYNRITGSIPVGMSAMTNLIAIRLANNSIDGTIPADLGSIEQIEVIDLQNLEISGQIPEQITQCKFLLELDVSGNSLTGGIPEDMGNLKYLEILDLHHNQLDGNIPSSLGSLASLYYSDFSENSLSGSIPSSFGNLGNLSYFNVSYNNLFGEIPLNGSIQRFGFSAFFHNAGLCGPPLENCLSAAQDVRKPKLSASTIVAIVAAVLIVMGVCIIIVFNIRARETRRRDSHGEEEDETMALDSTPLASSGTTNVITGKLVLFGRSLPLKYEDWEAGTKALLNKECLVGHGSIGTVYKTTFKDGVTIAVKKLETLGRIQSQDEFELEFGCLGVLCHPNLVTIQGYYWSSSMQLILSDFISNGNLHDHLHSSGNPRLNWTQRFRIAVGAARALAYLHHDCKPPVRHLNIKSANILLDESYTARLSDFGLVKLLPLVGGYGFTEVHNAVGYIAPELAQSSQACSKCDVYSFGVILLELVTGRMPVESSVDSEVLILREHVRQVTEKGRSSDCFDKSLRDGVENELIQVMKLGLICSSEVPSKRPNMAEVVQVLESIRNDSQV